MILNFNDLNKLFEEIDKNPEQNVNIYLIGSADSLYKKLLKLKN